MILRESKMKGLDETSETSMSRHENNMRWIHILSSDNLGRNTDSN